MQMILQLGPLTRTKDAAQRCFLKRCGIALSFIVVMILVQHKVQGNRKGKMFFLSQKELSWEALKQCQKITLLFHNQNNPSLSPFPAFSLRHFVLHLFYLNCLEKSVKFHFCSLVMGTWSPTSEVSAKGGAPLHSQCGPYALRILSLPPKL